MIISGLDSCVGILAALTLTHAIARFRRTGEEHNMTLRKRGIYALQLVDTTVCPSITRRTKSTSVTFKRISLQYSQAHLA